jgi:hypothetical protein
MTAMQDPNWHALTGLLFIACGLALLAKSAIGDMTRYLDEAGAQRSWCQQRVDGLMAVPFLAVGLVLLIAGQFQHGEFGPPLVLLALSAAFGLLLYLGLEGLVVERLFEQHYARATEARSLPVTPAAKPALAPEQRPALQIAHAS